MKVTDSYRVVPDPQQPGWWAIGCYPDGPDGKLGGVLSSFATKKEAQKEAELAHRNFLKSLAR